MFWEIGAVLPDRFLLETLGEVANALTETEAKPIYERALMFAKLAKSDSFDLDSDDYQLFLDDDDDEPFPSDEFLEIVEGAESWAVAVLGDWKVFQALEIFEDQAQLILRHFTELKAAIRSGPASAQKEHIL